jgi:putative ABC transport system ATP-binding protein
LAIARSLANEPTLLLADEPTGALDSEGGQEIIELLSRLHTGGQTIVLVTHDSDVAGAAKRVVRMRDGRITSGDAASGKAFSDEGDAGSPVPGDTDASARGVG